MSKIPTDKLLHFFCSLSAVLIFCPIFSYWGIVMGISLGIGKEIKDQIRYRGWDWKDLLADALGVLTGAIIWLIQKHFFL